MHRPPSSNVEYFNDMLDQLGHIYYSNNDEVISVGDLNYDSISVNRSVTNPLHQMETLYDMKQLVEVPTWVTLDTSTLLDVMLSTSPRSHVVTGVYCISISDHYMTYTVYDRIRIEITPRSKTLRFRNYNKLSPQ